MCIILDKLTQKSYKVEEIKAWMTFSESVEERNDMIFVSQLGKAGLHYLSTTTIWADYCMDIPESEALGLWGSPSHT